MRKKIVLVASIISIALLSFGIGAFAESKLNLVVNGQKIDNAEPKLIDNTTYVPLRVVAELLGATIGWDGDTYTVTVTGKDYKPSNTSSASDVTLHFPADKYPETGAHIKSAIAKGESAVCTIDRSGADQNREESLKGIPTKDGYDRDEWPMAMCAEGGTGADIMYISPADNRGAGSWVSNQLENYPDGTRVFFVVDGGDNAVSSTAAPSTNTATTTDSNATYSSCSVAKAAGVTPLHRGDPGYSSKLDRDGDGIACE